MNSAVVLLSALLGFLTMEAVSAQNRWNSFNANQNGGLNTPLRPASANQLGAPQDPSKNSKQASGGSSPQPMSPFSKLITGIVSGMAEQVLGVCPNMCENILDQVNTINPQIVSMIRAFFPCSNICNMAENVLNGGIGVMANMASQMG